MGAWTGTRSNRGPRIPGPLCAKSNGDEHSFSSRSKCSKELPSHEPNPMNNIKEQLIQFLREVWSEGNIQAADQVRRLDVQDPSRSRRSLGSPGTRPRRLQGTRPAVARPVSGPAVRSPGTFRGRQRRGRDLALERHARGGHSGIALPPAKASTCPAPRFIISTASGSPGTGRSRIASVCSNSCGRRRGVDLHAREGKGNDLRRGTFRPNYEEHFADYSRQVRAYL